MPSDPKDNLEKSCFYGIRKCPELVRAILTEGCKEPILQYSLQKRLPKAGGYVTVVDLKNRDGGNEFMWSNSKAVPKIGTKVRINFNDFGTGTVVSYFVEHKWMGVAVQVDREPEWRLKQGNAGTPALVMGREVEY